MKKILVSIIIAGFLFVSNTQAGEKTFWGIILLAGGAMMAVDGFSQITQTYYEMTPYTVQVKDKEWDEDVSNPSATITDWYWVNEKIISWWPDAYGNVKNTGNVTLKSITITAFYSDNFDLLINYQSKTYEALGIGNLGGWGIIDTQCIVEPIFCRAVVTNYTYDPIYEHRITYKDEVRYRNEAKTRTVTKNSTMGTFGIVGTGVGAYLLISDILEASKISQRYGVNIELVYNNQSIGLMFCKRI